ncbi:hypothetical protein VKT23_018464 [Stygiomarasmius scandens]|uniref:Uncharacterized protein n=1 Tax=Marasmiellus scandens TaxID=2682957 RepID=A0ABR1ISB3_9AGAR
MPVGERDKPDPSLILKDGESCSRAQTIKAKQSKAAISNLPQNDVASAPTASEQCAVDDCTGELKDASEINFYKSETDDISLGDQSLSSRSLFLTNPQKIISNEDGNKDNFDNAESDSDIEMANEAVTEPEEDITPGEKHFLQAQNAAKAEPTSRKKKSAATNDLRLCYEPNSVKINGQTKAGVFCKFCKANEKGVELKINKIPEAPGINGQQNITTFTVEKPGPIPPFSVEGLLEYILELIVDTDEAVR